MIAQAEHIYRITICSDEPEEDYRPSDYSSCFVYITSAYDRCVMFTVTFQNSADRDIVIGKTHRGDIWFLDLEDYFSGRITAGSDIETAMDEIACTDAYYSEDELPLISAAIVQIIKDYGYSLRPPAVYTFSPFFNSDLPF